MSRRTFLLRAILLVQIGILLWGGLSIWGLSWALGQSSQARQILVSRYIVYGVAASVLMAGVLVWQLQPVLRLLEAWDRDRLPAPALLSAAQARALSFPGQFFVAVALLVLIGNMIILAVRVQRPGYPFAQVLLEIVFNAALALGLAFAVSTGLRLLLRAGVLQSIVLARAWTMGGSLAVQITLMTLLLSLVAVGLGGTLTMASVLHALEQAAAEEQARWLEQIVVPQVLQLPAESRPDDVARFAGSGRELWLLDKANQVASRGLLPSPIQDVVARQVPGALLWSDDAGTARALTVPLGPDQTLALFYHSTAARSPVVIDTIQALAWLSLGQLLLALVLGAVTGGSLASTLRMIGARLRSLAGDMPTLPPLMAQTWPDELGELAVALNETQQRIAVLIGQRQESLAAFTTANQERRVLQETMQGLTAPVIRVADGLVIVPLTGYFDEERAAHIRPNLLAGIAAQRARIAVIDLTGVTEATDALIQYLSLAVDSAALMGCQVILTGTRPNVAWSLTQQRIDLASVAAHRDLEEGLAYAQARLRAS